MRQGRAGIKDLLAAYGLKPQRGLGQNFLADPNLVDRIVRTAGVGAGDRVVEVGAGTGALTRALAETGAVVVTYEVDGGLVPLLEGVLAGTDVEIRAEDVTRVDLSEALDGGPWTMVANLPYNVGTPLVLDTLRHAPAIRRMVIMVQKEVAARFLAGPGTRSYGVPSVVVALHATARLAFTVPREVFYPMPDVASAVVEITRIDPQPLTERAIDLAGTVFRQRRKMLRRSLAGVLEDPVNTLDQIGISATARPEDLEPSDFIELAGAIP